MWLNVQTMIRHVLPLRAHLFRYMCSLTDGELRVAGTRNMIELVWAAAKEPMENRCTFDRDSLELSLKYFTCSTLTIRLAGITHINVSLVQSRRSISSSCIHSLICCFRFRRTSTCTMSFHKERLAPTLKRESCSQITSLHFTLCKL